MKRKGFTLIELLAVIIILGILMLIAIPSVTNYINNSRKSTYVTTVDELVKGTIAKVNSGDLNVYDTDTTYYVPCTCIKLENGEAKSPYGKFDPAYVVVTFDGNNYHYYFTGKDVQNMGVPTLTSSDLLSKENIVANVDAIDTTVGIEGTSNVYVFSDECNGEGEIGPAGTTVSGGSSSSGNGSSSSGGGTSTPTCKKQTCPASVTPTIYWALQDTDSDGLNDKLVISSSSVTGNKSGSFAGNTSFSTWTSVPWGTTASTLISGSNSSNNLSYYVNKVVIEGVVAPTSTSHWFTAVGHGSSSLHMDLSNLYTCYVTDMNYMFLHAGYNATGSFLIDGLCSWDTSKVTYLYGMFEHAGYNATTINLDLSGWDTSKVKNMNIMFSSTGSNATTFNLDLSSFDTSKVTTMHSMFHSAGSNATTWSIGDISSWDTSKVTTMHSMFYRAGYNATTWSIGDISSWDTSKVTSMYAMFGYTGYKATTFNLDLSDWNTSNVTDMGYMFYWTGSNATTFNLDLSSFDTSKVTSMSYMFELAGSNATTFKITIPKTNGNGINNTTSLLYGSSTSYSASPPSGRSFTLAS